VPASLSSSLRITHSTRGGAEIIRLEGVIDESFNQAEFVQGAGGTVLIDMDGVKRITSYGVREWIHALRVLKHDYLAFIHCRPVIVAQFNMIQGFAADGELLTFYAPYICEACGNEQDELIDLSNSWEDIRKFIPKEIQCARCSKQMELDDIPQSYFVFAARQPRPRPPPAALAALAPAEPTVGLQILKDVQGTITTLTLSGDLDERARFKRVGDGLEGRVVINFASVKSATPEGLSALIRFIDSAQAELYLARIPPSMISVIDSNALFQKAQPVTVLEPLTCAQCSANVNVELDEADVAKLAAGVTFIKKQCPKCKELTPVQASERTRRYKAWPFMLPPQDVSEFLEKGTAATNTASTSVSDSASGVSFGRYQLLKLLGTGGMAEVCLARQSGMAGFEKYVVIKRILPNLSSEDSMVRLFMQEARLAARLSHPNVVQIFDMGQVGGRHFIAMEYVRGWDLNTILRRCIHLKVDVPVDIAARIMSDVSAGVHAAHSSQGADGSPDPIIHRDISPHNVLISVDGLVKVTDFGIAKAKDARHSNRTPTKAVKGKYAYLAPEIVGGSPANSKTDIFAMGLVYYQCLTFQQPFRGANDLETLRRVLHHEPAPIRQLREGVPESVEAVVARAIARDPNKRYSTALEFHKDLATALPRLPGSAELAEWLQSLDLESPTSSSSPSPLNRATATADYNSQTSPALKVGSAVETKG